MFFEKKEARSNCKNFQLEYFPFQLEHFRRWDLRYLCLIDMRFSRLDQLRIYIRKVQPYFIIPKY